MRHSIGQVTGGGQVDARGLGMSAIYGMVRFDGRGVAESEIVRMGNALAAQSPDGREHFVDGGIGLGHGALHLLRDEQFDAQPVYDRATGLVLVADIRLDNRETLATSLDIAAASLATLADSALLLAAWGRWGSACLPRLIGEFAIAVWEARARRLTLARDAMGQRQLLYHRSDDRIVFGSGVAALWAAEGVPRALHSDWLSRRADRGFDFEPGTTGLAGIDGLVGGAAMTIPADGAHRTERYWEPHADPRHVGRDEAYYVATYRSVLEEAVACRLRRLDRAPGLVLSGGYDSGAIAGLAGPTLRDAGTRLICATATAPPDAPDPRDPRPWVALCAEHMPHLDTHLVDSPGDLLTDIDQAFGAVPTGVGIDHQTNCALLATLAKAGARLVMDGHGGDYTLNPRGRFLLARLLSTGRMLALVRETRAHRRMTGEGWRQTLWGEMLRPLVPAPLARLWQRFRHRDDPWTVPLLLLQRPPIRRRRRRSPAGHDRRRS